MSKLKPLDYTIIYPTVEELKTVNKKVNCSECSATFNSKSNLNLHLAKTHKKTDLLPSKQRNKIFHCPVINCNYNSSSFFKEFKLVKQHYMKTHSEKNYECNMCHKKFATEAYRDNHIEFCNIEFTCCDCKQVYTCYETLKTHSRRKKHKIHSKHMYKGYTSIKYSKSDITLPSNKFRLLLPKPSNSAEMIDTLEQSSQTDMANTTKQSTQETQTLLTTRLPQLTVETQTIGDYFTKKSESFCNILKSIKTQTLSVVPKSASCNTSPILEDFEMSGNEVERNSSSTQTSVFNESECIYSASNSTRDSAYTDTSDLLRDTFDSNFFNCNMETQTDFMFDDELFKYCDDYTNMYTQTCEDLLLGEIEFNNTQTQTVFDDVLKSVESQTVMSQSNKMNMSYKDMTHMETQTEIHFKKMLEEINE